MSTVMHTSPAKQQRTGRITEIGQVYELIADDMHKVNDLILTRLHSEVALINQMGAYIVNSGGKRLRPVLTLLAARAMGYGGDKHLPLAAIIEFIHTATLLHDDVVDASSLRRGKDTANALWGNEAAVLVGDFLYSRAFEMMVEIGSMPVMAILANTTNIIAEGEVMQLLNCHDADTSEERYLQVIRSKTAKLFEAAARLGGVLSGADEETCEKLARYGMHLGTAFQIVDDVLDYSESNEDIGKNIGDDLAEGKPTLPLIHAIKHGNPDQAAIVRDAIENGRRESIDQVRQAIESTGAISYTAQAAEDEARLARGALNGLPDSIYMDALHQLARFSVYRTY